MDVRNGDLTFRTDIDGGNSGGRWNRSRALGTVMEGWDGRDRKRTKRNEVERKAKGCNGTVKFMRQKRNSTVFYLENNIYFY